VELGSGQGEELSAAELEAIIRDTAGMRYSKTEIAAFVVICAGFFSTAEVRHLTRAMAAVGTRLRWPDEMVVDKRCIGGIPGNRTSMILVPIVSAHGLTIPRTSSRTITSPGTADTMEILARVDIDTETMRDILAAEKGCLVWGGHVTLSPADDVLISVERPLNTDARGQLVASVLSKKLPASSNRLVIDIPVGPTAKVPARRRQSSAQALRARRGPDRPSAEVRVTTGTQPIGRGVGPALKARDVLQVLSDAAEAPVDLRERGLRLTGRILEFDPALRGGAGIARARELLTSGAALAKMERIMGAGGRPPETAALGRFTRKVAAAIDGVVTAIDCHRIARLARLAGALTDRVPESSSSGSPAIRSSAASRSTASAPACRSIFRIASEEAAEDTGFGISPARGWIKLESGNRVILSDRGALEELATGIVWAPQLDREVLSPTHSGAWGRLTLSCRGRTAKSPSFGQKSR
jgi:thymidine phosphorylase